MTTPAQPKPTDWQELRLGDLFKFSNGINADKSAYGSGVPFVNVMEIVNNESLKTEKIPGRVNLPRKVLARYEVRQGDILFNRTSETQDEVGLTSVYLGKQPVVFGGFVFRGRPLTTHLDLGYSKYALRASEVRGQITARGQGGIRANVSQRDLKDVIVTLPSVAEQQAITEALDDASDHIELLERLIVKRQDIKQGLMQQLLTGQVRLPGFSAQWQSRKLEELLAPRVERNAGTEHLEVLSCTKYKGFVRSLDYFRNQVFSRNLSGYRVIRRGDIGYPANHVEEGSIGVQEIYEAALVSPIYVVMRSLGGVDTYFIQRQLKLDYFRQEFARVTNASVNRRGSLRWPQFSQIEVLVPDYDEQCAVSRCLRDSEAELRVLQRRLAKARAIKQGMMQQLLTGRTRLPVQETAA